jgi:hypothetical protein
MFTSYYTSGELARQRQPAVPTRDERRRLVLVADALIHTRSDPYGHES